MAARIIEWDWGTKKATVQQMKKIQLGAPPILQHKLFGWWRKVYQSALVYCPVETGALRASIRLQTGPNHKPYDVSRGECISELYITAGGGGVINPKHKREVDYAEAVHDGTLTTPSNPFLNRAMADHMTELDNLLQQHSNMIGQWWEQNQPVPTGVWKLPIRLVGQYSHLVY